MRPVERRLRANGYEVLNPTYPSRSADIATLAANVFREIREWEPDDSLDFVTHSMGGILVRHAVAQGHIPLERIRRVVMLGPPNQGSELADVLPRVPAVGAVYRRITGPAGLELGTTSDSVPPRLPPAEFEVGVIAGTRSINPVFSAILGGPSDGKVRVDSARLEGMSDFLEMPQWHPLLMSDERILDQTMHFLEHGRFSHDSEPA